MKSFKTISALTFSLLFLITQTSCQVVSDNGSGNNGKHRGWYKNPNNPHNPNTTNPGEGKTKSKSRGNSKK